MSGGLWLGRASADDPPRLAALEGDCHTHPWTLRQFVEEVRVRPPGGVLVLYSPRPSERWGPVRAYCVYRLVLDEMHILNVAVAPPCRRQGLGRWLVRFAMAQAARAGARQGLLEVRESNQAALALYRCLGFRTLGRRRSYYTRPPEDALVLALEPLPGADP